MSNPDLRKREPEAPSQESAQQVTSGQVSVGHVYGGQVYVTSGLWLREHACWIRIPMQRKITEGCGRVELSSSPRRSERAWQQFVSPKRSRKNGEFDSQKFGQQMTTGSWRRGLAQGLAKEVVRRKL